ncbi:MAG: hypothetical protein AAGF79_02400 [Pseudomonadota bacterium]
MSAAHLPSRRLNAADPQAITGNVTRQLLAKHRVSGGAKDGWRDTVTVARLT